MRGYTTFTQERGDEAAATLAMRFAAIARSSLEAGGGSGLEFRGDEVMAVFTSARQAIRAAVDLQSAFVQASIDDPSLALPVGIGLDAGEAVEVADGYRGGALNLAARLCSIAGPGEILASDSVVHLARRVEGVSHVDRGSATLKGLVEPVRLTLLTKEGWDPAHDDAFQHAVGRSAGRTGAGFAICPYRGLAAFQPEDADRFFGRDELVAELVDRIDRDRVLFVVGPSGSGKSSAVRAGLIPGIRAGAVAGSDRWAVALFSPRSSAASELSYQLHRAAERAGVRASGSGDTAASPSPTEVRAIADAVCDSTGGLLILIDQFEELFTLSPRREQEVFVQMLAAIADPPGSQVRVVMAMRADFYGVCATFPWLVRRATANQALVGPMSRTGLRKVIEQPAASSGLRLEDGLVDLVLEDAGTDAAALPLISHAMAETWRRRDGQTLSLQGYRDAGGVAGSISQTADTLYETALTEPEQQACRRLMLRLVAPGEGTSDTRRRLPMRELDRDRDPALSLRVAAEMTDARLLTVDRDSLEIAHEALLRSWPRLRRWIDEGRDELRTRQRIGHAAAEWHAQERDPDLLYRGTPLHAAREWAADHGDALGPTEQEFLAASVEALERDRARAQEASRRSRRLRRVAVSVLGVLTVAAVVASLIAFSALGESRRRYAESLATQARALADSDPRTAIALAAEAMARTGTDPVDARAALVDASQALAARFVRAGPAVQVGDASTVAVRPDGSLIVTGNRDGSISTWSATGMGLATNVPGHTLAIEELDFTPDGRWLVSGSDDASVLLWDLADPTDMPAPIELGTASGIVWSVTVAPDGKTAASASEDGTINLWDLKSQRQIGGVEADLAFDTITASFSPDGELLLIGNGLGEVTGLSVDDRSIAIPTFQAHDSDVWEIEFDEDGSRFATASSDGRVRVWDAATLDLVAEPFDRSAFDARGVLMLGDDVLAGDEQGRLLVAPVDGSVPPTASAPRSTQIVDAAWGSGTLATLSDDQRMQLWSPGDEPVALSIEEQKGGAFALAANPDGTRVAVGDGEGTVRVYSSTTGELELGPLGLHDGKVWGLAISEDGTRIASGGEDGTVVVIDAQTGQPLGGPPTADDAIRSVLWVDDGLLTAGEDGMVRIWEGGRLEGELGPHAGAVTAIALGPDGTLAVADASGQVWFWDLGVQEQVGDPLAAEDNTIWGIAWSTDGSTLATASDDGVVTLWDAGSRSQIGSLTPQPGGAADVAFLDDGHTIVTTSREGVVQLWDLAEVTPLGGQLQGHQAASWRTVALVGMLFATSSEDGTVRIWDVLNLDRACERAEGTLGLEALGSYLGEGEEPIACTGS